VITKGRVVLLLLAAAIAYLVIWYSQWQHWLSHGTGSYDTPGVAHHYNFFSGFGSDLGQYTIVTALISNVVVVWRAHTCQRYWWCWRPPAKPLDGTQYKLCALHHPEPVPTVAEAVELVRQNGTAG
jgi:hypothetical protein